MSSIVWSKEGKPVRQSHNLRGVLEYARGRGVASIDVYQLCEGKHRPTGYVVITYRTGETGETYFVCGSHAAEWATDRAKKNRASWFSECAVRVHVVKAGAWDYNHSRPHLALCEVKQ